MNKKVLLLTTPFRPNVGGVETHLDDLIFEGTKKNIKFIVITYQPLMTKDWGKSIEKGKGFIVYRIPWIRLNLFLILEKYPILEFIYLFPGLFIGTIFYLMFNSSKVNVIHAQGLVAGAIGVIAGMIFDKDVIISTHSIYNFPHDNLYSKFVKFIFNKCKVILCVSRQSQNEVINLGIPSNKVKTFTLWVDQKIFKQINKYKARKELELDQKKFYCLFVGRLVAVKGISELISATKLAKEINFLIVGDGPMAKDLDEAEKEIDNINFVGRIENRLLKTYYSASDVLIVPSTHEEGFGRVILEALSCGLPVIGSNRGAIVDAISKDVGFLIDVTPNSIKDALYKLMRNKRELARMAKNARKFAVENYNKRNIKMIIKYY